MKTTTEAKRNWLREKLRRLVPHHPVWRAVTITLLVVILTSGVLWGTGILPGFIRDRVPSPDLIPTPAPTPLPSPITILSDTTLTTDLTFEGNGIIIRADNITLDLGGYTITGPGKGPWIWPEPALSSVAIQLTDRKGITIRNGHVKGFATGLLIVNSEGIVAQNITTSLNHYGIYLWGSSNNTLMENNITSNIYGLHLMGTSENRIIKNHVFYNHYDSPGGYGICLIASSNNTITENTIDSNQTQGIWLIESWDNLVTENTIDSNQAQGIWLAESWGNLIYHNNMIGNQPNAVDEPFGMNLWYDPASKEGNYWGDYEGADSDGDGIGDTHYEFYEQGRDLYPFVHIDGWVGNIE